MLELVEVVPAQRRALRRAVDLSCELVCDLWDEPVEHSVRDLSEQGLFVETPYPLHPGSEVIMQLETPRQGSPIVTLGTVRRASLCRRRGERSLTGMGIEFVDLERDVRQQLRESLRGIPPPLPMMRPRQTDLVWVEMMLTWEETLDDRVNVWEVSELIVAEELDAAFDQLVPLGELLTHARSRFRLAS